MEHNMVCRTCLDTEDLMPVYSDVGDQYELAARLHSYVKIPIELTDEYTVMCGKCIGTLTEFHAMFTLAQDVQKHFSKVLVLHDPKTEDVAGEECVSEIIEVKHEEIIEQEEVLEEQVDEEDIIEETVYEEYEVDHNEIVAAEEEDDEIGEEEEEEFESPRQRSRPAAKRSPGPPSKKRLKRSEGARSLSDERLIDDELIRTTINLQCTLCSVTLDTFESLMLHYREQHKVDGTLKCCGREFKRRFKVVEHAKLHLNPDEFACEICEKKFASKYYLTHHMSVHIPEEERMFQCEKCSKRFPTKARLSSHVQSHNEEYNFKCHICDKAFNQKIVLNSHIKYVHERTSNYICEICAKEFRTKEAFVAHQVNHLETPPPRVACHICGLKLKNKDTLNQHLLRHKRENERHGCDECSKEFNCKKRLRQHKKYVHATEKLKCTYCTKEFKRPICLKEHMAQHTGDVLYKCKFCARQFNSNANKYSHQKAQHPVEWEAAMRMKMEG